MGMRLPLSHSGDGKKQQRDRKGHHPTDWRRRPPQPKNLPVWRGLLTRLLPLLLQKPEWIRGDTKYHWWPNDRP